jgi:type IV secretory pathway TrbD component
MPDNKHELSTAEKVSHNSRAAAKQLEHISNRLAVIVILLVIGFFVLPLGIILWVIALFMFMSIFVAD